MARIVSADAVDVGQDHRAPVLGRLLEEAARRAEAGIGKDHVDPPKALERGRSHRLDLIPLGDVAAHRQRPLVTAELLNQLLERLEPPRRQHESVAIGSRPRGRGTNTAARTGDQGGRDRRPRVAFSQLQRVRQEAGLQGRRTLSAKRVRRPGVRLARTLSAKRVRRPHDARPSRRLAIIPRRGSPAQAEDPTRRRPECCRPPGGGARLHVLQRRLGGEGALAAVGPRQARAYDLTGKVVPGSIRHHGAGAGLPRRRPRRRRADASGHLQRHGPGSVPRRPRDRPHWRGRARHLRRRTRHAGDQVPVEVHRTNDS